MELLELLDSIISNKLANLNFCQPASIISYDYRTKKAVVQPDLNTKYNDGEIIEMPQIHNVPVVHPAAGRASITFPVEVGDKVLLLHSQRSLEDWLKNGNKQTPDDPRQFDLTDAVAIIGLFPFSSTSAAENNTDLLISYDGSKVKLKPSGIVQVEAESAVINATNVEVNADNVEVVANQVDVQATEINLDAANVNITGDLEVAGEMTSLTAIIGGKAFAAHTHLGVTPGPGTTGAVA
jgi:hypothetical protein